MSFRHQRALHAWVGLALALLLCACSEPDPATLMGEARQAQARGELRGAVIVLKNLIQRVPAHQPARLLLGELHLEQGDPQSAEKELRRVLALGGDGTHVTQLLGKSLLMQGQYARLLKEVKPDSAPAARPATLALRASALLGLGKVEDARALLNEALAPGADAPEPLLGLARIAIWEKQTTLAHTLIRRALAASPGHVDSLRLQSDLLRAQGQPEAALAAQQAILARHPHQPQALVDIANLHTDAGRVAEARAALKAARRVAGPGIGMLYAEAMLDYRQNNIDAALETIQRVLHAAPEHAPSILLAGALHVDQGAHRQASQHLKKFLHMYPGHPYASKLMVSIHLAGGDPAAALAVLRPLLREQGGDAELLALAGEAELRARRFTEASALFERASALQPGTAALHTGLALSRIGSGDSTRAVAELERAAALDRDPSRSGMLLVMGYLRANLPDKAMTALQQLEQRSDNPLVQNLKGGVFLAKGDPGGARASFERALAFEPAYLPALSNLERLDTLEQRPADSRRRYAAALQKAPRNSGLMEALARLDLAAGRRAEAIAWIERARAEQPGSLPLALRAASVYQRAGQPQKALQLARQLQTMHPSHAEVLLLAGQAAVAAGQPGDAADAYARLAALTPAAGRPHLLLANVRIAQRQPAAALAALHKALALEPNLLDARITLVNLLLKQGNPAAALATASALVKQQPDSAAGHKLEGDVLSAQGKYGAARAAYQQAFAREPSGPALIQLTSTLQRLGQQDTADLLAARWLRQHPRDVPTRMHLASARLVADDPRAAIPLLEAVLQAEPNHLAALNDLAWSYQRIGAPQALALAERAHAQAPGNPTVIDTLGWIHLERGDLARALPLLRKASMLAPAAPEIQYHYGMALARTGDRSGARRALNQALGVPAFSRRAQARALLDTL